jgi:hypothetical protein
VSTSGKLTSDARRADQRDSEENTTLVAAFDRCTASARANEFSLRDAVELPVL